MLPIVINTKWFLGGYKARCLGPVIICPNDAREQFLSHEMAHYHDWRAMPLKSVWLRLTNWKFRLWMELRAYRLSHTYEETAMLLRKKGYGIPNKYSAREVTILTGQAIILTFKEFARVV